MSMKPFQKLFLLPVLLFFLSPLLANEGMWLPLLLKLNEQEMQSMGMKMSAEDIYSVNRGSLKDAIVLFGGGCTGSIISQDGLLITNHHCGRGRIQAHTTLENDYMGQGFWAKDRSGELSNPGLTVTFLSRMDDVTKAILSNVTPDMDPATRQSTIDQNISRVINTAEKEAHEDVTVRSFYDGNQYFMLVTVTYRDIRLVGAPPDAIGSFGHDTDNWEWPRHGGDFSLFRVYAGADNLPADYSADNVPFQPKRHLKISTKGIAPDDFTLVFGFPGRTNEYLPASAVREIVEVTDPIRIAFRDRSLAILDRNIRRDPEIKIKYIAHMAGISNGWKKWKGEIQGLEKANALAKKEQYEADFTELISSRPEWKTRYGTLLGDLKNLYRDREPYLRALVYYSEFLRVNTQILPLADRFERLVNAFQNNGQTGYDEEVKKMQAYLPGFFKDYDAGVDQEIYASVLELFATGLNAKYLPEGFLESMDESKGDFQAAAAALFSQSVFPDQKKLEELLRMPAEKALEKITSDPAYQINQMLSGKYNEDILPPYRLFSEQVNELQRLYMQAQMEVFPKKRFYPDANSTLRVSYGKVEGFDPRDGLHYEYQTYLDGVIEKHKPGDYEFEVPEKLIRLYERKDFGPYVDQTGKVPVCFLASNHTTGGNSGSPVLDANGSLIGLNFDRVWEGTMSDIYYDPSICRNISVDIRYVLFIVDKFAGAGHLVSEMELIR